MRFKLLLFAGLLDLIPFFLHAQEFKALSRLSYYMQEEMGEVMVVVPENITGNEFRASLQRNEDIIQTGVDLNRGINLISFDLTEIRPGEDTLLCRISGNGRDIEMPVIVRILPPKYNAVQIDRLSGGLIVHGLPFFPVGFYCYWPVQPTLPEEEVVKGFNMISPYQRIGRKTRKERMTYLDRCMELGIKVHYNLLSVAGGGGVGSGTGMTRAEKQEMLIEEVNAIKDHPALLAWYVSDEPVGQQIPVDLLIETKELINELDPYHPVTIVFMAPHKAGDYINAMDIVMADPYPIPNSPVNEVSEVTRNLIQEFYPGKPVWIVPQAFGGNEWWQREPTPDELYVMTYLGIVGGATGIQYFIRHGMNAFPKSTIAWGAASRAALELNELIPFLFSDDHTEVNCDKKEIVLQTWQHGNDILLIAVNPSNKPLQCLYTLPESYQEAPSDVLFKNRSVMPLNGKLKDFIDAMDVRIYRLKKAKMGSEDDSANYIVDPGFEAQPSAGIPTSVYAKLGGDRGATYFLDPRTFVDGSHSLRMITPTTGKGYSLDFYRFYLKTGKTYTYSVWAKCLPHDPEYHPLPKEGFLKRLFSKPDETGRYPSFTLSVRGAGSKSFILDTTWRKYEFAVDLTHRNEGTMLVTPSLELTGAGTAWFDQVQFIADLDVSSIVSDDPPGFILHALSSNPVDEFRYCIGDVFDISESKRIDSGKVISQSTKLWVAAIRNGLTEGHAVIDLVFHEGIGRKPQLNIDYSMEYPGSGRISILDGLTGSASYRDQNWQGFKGDIDVVVDLGKTTTIYQMSAGFLEDQRFRIFFPESVEFLVSNDGKEYQTVYTGQFSEPDRDRTPKLRSPGIDNLSIKARFVKLRIKTIGNCPDWHVGAGKPAWLFIDEFIINEL